MLTQVSLELQSVNPHGLPYTLGASREVQVAAFSRPQDCFLVLHLTLGPGSCAGWRHHLPSPSRSSPWPANPLFHCPPHTVSVSCHSPDHSTTHLHPHGGHVPTLRARDLPHHPSVFIMGELLRRLCLQSQVEPQSLDPRSRGSAPSHFQAPALSLHDLSSRPGLFLCTSLLCLPFPDPGLVYFFWVPHWSGP